MHAVISELCAQLCHVPGPIRLVSALGTSEFRRTVRRRGCDWSMAAIGLISCRVLADNLPVQQPTRVNQTKRVKMPWARGSLPPPTPHKPMSYVRQVNCSSIALLPKRVPSAGLWDPASGSGHQIKHPIASHSPPSSYLIVS